MALDHWPLNLVRGGVPLAQAVVMAGIAWWHNVPLLRRSGRRAGAHPSPLAATKALVACFLAALASMTSRFPANFSSPVPGAGKTQVLQTAAQGIAWRDARSQSKLPLPGPPFPSNDLVSPALAALHAGTHRGSRVPRGAFDMPMFGEYDLRKAASSVFGDGDGKVEVPPDVASLVDGLKASTQEQLNRGISRLDVEAPPGFRFGVEGKKGRLLREPLPDDDRQDIARSDRELARLYIEMLQPIANGLCVAFRTKKLAAAAKKTWKLQGEEGTVISFPEKARSAFASEVGGPLQFRKQLQDLRCQCLIVVAPYLEQLRMVHDIGREVKDQMGIVLLNARIHGRDRKTLKMPPKLKASLQEAFPPAYHIRFLEQMKNTLLFHMVASGEDDQPGGPEPWIVARQRELIGGNTITEEVLRTAEEPSLEEIEKALEEFQAKDKGVGDKILDVLDKESLPG